MALPQTEPDDLFDEDQEILEIFVEEAEEVLETINSNFPVWVENENDEVSMTEIRRSFHTLKGSGRMVKASQIGELAWSIENMLNRLISNAIQRTQSLVDLIDNVRQVMPSLVEAFKNKQTAALVGVDVELLISQAEKLANGEEIAEISTTQSVAETAEPVVEPPELKVDPTLVTIDEKAYRKDMRDINDRVDILTAAIDDVLVSIDRVSANAVKVEASTKSQSSDPRIKKLTDRLSTTAEHIDEIRSSITEQSRDIEKDIAALQSSVGLQVKSGTKRIDNLRSELSRDIQLVRAAANDAQSSIIIWSIASGVCSSLLMGGVLYLLLS